MSEEHTGKALDPHTARLAIRNYYATTDAKRVMEDVRRFSPELAARLGIAAPRTVTVRAGIIRRFAAFGRSIHRLFS